MFTNDPSMSHLVWRVVRPTGLGEATKAGAEMVSGTLMLLTMITLAVLWVAAIVTVIITFVLVVFVATLVTTGRRAIQHRRAMMSTTAPTEEEL